MLIENDSSFWNEFTFAISFLGDNHILLDCKISWIRDIWHLSYYLQGNVTILEINVLLVLLYHPHLTHPCFTYKRNAFYSQLSCYFSHISSKLITFLPRLNYDCMSFFQLQMCFSGIHFCIIVKKKVKELINWARQDDFIHFLFFFLHNFRIKKADLDVTLIKGSSGSKWFLSLIQIIFFLMTIEYFWRYLFLLPKSINNPKSIVAFKASKMSFNKGMIIFFLDKQWIRHGFLDILDGLNGDDALLDDTKHIGDEHKMILANV